MSNPFSAPSTASGIEWADLKGALLLIKVHSIEPAVKTVHGETSAVRADVVVLDGTNEGTEHLDTLIFPKVLQSQVKAKVGGMVLGRLGQGVAKPGQSKPWMLGEFTEADAALGTAYIERTTETPF